MSAPTLLDQVHALLDAAVASLGACPEATRLEAVRTRLDEPLRIAFAGRLKAGKSTLLNALIGEELAATDARECTRLVTWYRDGLTYRVIADRRDGEHQQLRFSRDGGPVEIDLEGLTENDVSRLIVEWPSAALRTMTLIDTPGLGSLSAGVSERTTEFLHDPDRPTEADAVVYLMRHLHGSDVAFLESFRDDVGSPTPINAIAVLSRADEVAGGRLDAMVSAERIARRYRGDERVRRLCQTVVPVAGLLAHTGASFTQDEFRALRVLAEADQSAADALLLSVDRFLGTETSIPLTPMERGHLAERLGLFGTRYAVRLLRSGEAADAPALAEALVAHSGVRELRRILQQQFGERAHALKARSALLAIETALQQAGAGVDPALESEIERVWASAHEFAEIRVMNALHTGAVAFRTEDDLHAALQLLGADGASAHARLGLGTSAPAEEFRAAITTALTRWQRIAEHPMSAREVTEAARVLVRTCEVLAAGLESQS